MAFKIPNNMSGILMLLLSLVPNLIDEAELAFSGDPGNGPAKKEFIMKSARGLIAMQETIKSDFLTKPQEDAILLVVDKQIDATVAILSAIKLFQVPKSPTV